MAVEIIAEVAQAHDGSLGTAFKFIDIARRCGVDTIKFQTHIAEYESTPNEPWRVKFSHQDATRFDYWKRMEFTEQQWKELFDYSRAAGLDYLGTPFSVEGLEMLRRIGVKRWKLASGEVSNSFLTDALASLGEPVLISSGMSNWAELDSAVYKLKDKVPLTVLQCTSEYPVPPEHVGLNLLAELRDRYGLPVGLSDHTGDIFAGLAATALGAKVIEVHICLSKDAFGPDTEASLTPEQLERLIKGIRSIETMLVNPVSKDEKAEELAEIHSIFTKSLYLKQDVDAGTAITREMLCAKKPGSGVPVSMADEVIGRTTLHSLKAGACLQFKDYEE